MARTGAAVARTVAWSVLLCLVVLEGARIPRSFDKTATHEDSYALFELPAMGLFSGDPNPHRFIYGAPGIYYIHAVWRVHYWALRLCGGYGIHSPQDYVAAFYADPAPFYGVARVGMWLLRVIAICLVCAMGSRLGGPMAGSVAVVLFALDSTAKGFGTVLSADTPILFLGAAIAYYAVTRPWAEFRLTRHLVLGTIIGLSIATKMLGVIYAGAYICWCLWLLTPHNPRAALGALAVGVGGIVLGLGLGSPYIVLAWHEFAADMQRQALFHAGQAYASRLETPLHVVGNLGLPGRGLGTSGFLMALIGTLHAVRARDLRTGFLAMTFLTGVLFLSVQPMMHRNYLISILPVACLLAGLGTVVSVRYLASLRWFTASCGSSAAERKAQAVRKTAAIGVLVALVVGPHAARSLLGLVPREESKPHRYAWYPCERWVEQNVPAHTAVLMVANPQYAPRLLPTVDSPDQPRDTYLGERSAASVFLRSSRELAATKYGQIKPPYKLFHRMYVGAQRAPADTSTVPRDNWRPFEWYVEKGVEYVVVDESLREQFDTPARARDHRFFSDLRHRGTLVSKFRSSGDYPAMEVWAIGGSRNGS